jgi:hypothetical protein
MWSEFGEILESSSSIQSEIDRKTLKFNYNSEQVYSDFVQENFILESTKPNGELNVLTEMRVYNKFILWINNKRPNEYDDHYEDYYDGRSLEYYINNDGFYTENFTNDIIKVMKKYKVTYESDLEYKNPTMLFVGLKIK